MRIFYSFLIMVTAVILILLPITSGVYDFRTDLREDNITVYTAPATTNATIQLFKDIYDDDTSTITLSSNNANDIPVWSSYNTTTRALVITGLTANITRTITVAYDVEAVSGSALGTFLDYLPWIWILMWVALPIAALVAIWTGRA